MDELITEPNTGIKHSQIRVEITKTEQYVVKPPWRTPITRLTGDPYLTIKKIQALQSMGFEILID